MVKQQCPILNAHVSHVLVAFRDFNTIPVNGLLITNELCGCGLWHDSKQWALQE